MNKPTRSLSEAWEIWCHRGRLSVGNRRRAVLRCMDDNGDVRGYHSDLLLDPTLPPTHSLYPSIEHLTFPKLDSEVVVETRIVNDMKSHLSETDFWQMIEHLYVVGRTRDRIPASAARRDSWTLGRNY